MLLLPSRRALLLLPGLLLAAACSTATTENAREASATPTAASAQASGGTTPTGVPVTPAPVTRVDLSVAAVNGRSDAIVEKYVDLDATMGDPNTQHAFQVAYDNGGSCLAIPGNAFGAVAGVVGGAAGLIDGLLGGLIGVGGYPGACVAGQPCGINYVDNYGLVGAVGNILAGVVNIAACAGNIIGDAGLLAGNVLGTVGYSVGSILTGPYAGVPYAPGQNCVNCASPYGVGYVNVGAGGVVGAVVGAAGSIVGSVLYGVPQIVGSLLGGLFGHGNYYTTAVADPNQSAATNTCVTVKWHGRLVTGCKHSAFE